MGLGAIFTSLCDKLGEDLQRKGYACKTIGIKLRYDDFKIATRDQTMKTATVDSKTIRRIAGLCLKRVPLEQRLRLLGVRASNLIKLGDLAENAKNSSETTEKGLEKTSKMTAAQSIRSRAASKLIADDQLF